MHQFCGLSEIKLRELKVAWCLVTFGPDFDMGVIHLAKYD